MTGSGRPGSAPKPRSPRDKILSRRALVERYGPRESGVRSERVVFTNGCFDLLHVGHVTYLHEARQLGDRLVVGLNSDASVRRLKGSGRPLVEERARATVLAALASVDAVTLFDEDTPAALVEALVPDVLVKGGDYRVEDVVGAGTVQEAGGDVVILPFVEGFSTTALVDSIREGTP